MFVARSKKWARSPAAAPERAAGHRQNQTSEVGLESDAGPDWEKVRLEVKLGKRTRNAICHSYGITTQRLAERIRVNKWDVAEDATMHDYGLLVGQLRLALELQVRHLTEIEVAGSGEREVGTLQKLTATLDKLIELDRQVSGRKPERRQSREMQELRNRIAKRLNELEVK